MIESGYKARHLERYFVTHDSNLCSQSHPGEFTESYTRWQNTEATEIKDTQLLQVISENI